MENTSPNLRSSDSHFIRMSGNMKSLDDDSIMNTPIPQASSSTIDQNNHTLTKQVYGLFLILFFSLFKSTIWITSTFTVYLVCVFSCTVLFVSVSHVMVCVDHV